MTEAEWLTIVEVVFAGVADGYQICSKITRALFDVEVADIDLYIVWMGSSFISELHLPVLDASCRDLARLLRLLIVRCGMVYFYAFWLHES